jgi:membrane fusion protein (multidrug efflux system)
MANMAPVISRVSGYIAEVKVKDNQFVKKGDTLVILDNRDQKMQVQQAEAALQTAQNSITAAQASTQATSQNINSADAAIATLDAQIEAAKVSVWRTAQDLKRYEHLIKDHSITQQQYEQVLAAKQTADKQLQIIVEQKKQAQQQTHIATSQTHASTQQIGTANAVANQRRVDVENAKLNLSYTVVVAPENGFVAKVPVQSGQFVQAGAQLFSLVRDNQLWVVANFKETQLTKMQAGQKATIKVDAFPDTAINGVINSLSPATGSSFSILPPDNASGNFVKVVQRVPVRIDLSNVNKATAQKLRAGMNVTAEVQLKN